MAGSKGALDLDALRWLEVPAGDVNFKGTLDRANIATLQAALERLHPGAKTKRKLLEARLKQLNKEEHVGKKDAEVEVLESVSKMARESADAELATMRENLGAVHNVGLISGRAQAFSAMKLIGEFLEYKQIAQIIDGEDYLKIPGVTSVDDYLEKLGLGRSTAYKNLKIARSLTVEEIQLLGQVGFTRRDLLGYASLPGDKLLELREGKIINLETASREEIKDLIEQVVVETKQEREEAAATIKAKDKVLKDKETVINRQAKDLVKFDRRAREKELTPEEDALLGKIETLGVELTGYGLAIESVRDALMENPFPNAVAAFITLMDNVKMKVAAFRDNALDVAPAGMVPEEEWVPPPLRETGKTD